MMRRRLGVLVAASLAFAALAASPGSSDAQSRTCLGRTVTIQAVPGQQTVGTSGPDVIRGTSGDDVIVGRGGADRICAGGGDDEVRGGKGADRIDLGGGRDVALGGRGQDQISGGKGADNLHGGGGRDSLRGGRGHDQLDGGKGIDTCDGGPGIDTEVSCNEVVLLNAPDWTPSSRYLPCLDGRALDRTTRVDINPGLREILADAERLLAEGRGDDLGYTIMVYSGPLPARVAEHHWFGQTLESTLDLVGPSGLSGFLQLLQGAYHEGLHGLVDIDCVQTGLDTGVQFPSTLDGFPGSTIHADVIARIGALEAASTAEQAASDAFNARSVADVYLDGFGSEQGWTSMMAEMVAYVLDHEWQAAMVDTLDLAELSWSHVGVIHSAKWHQLYRYLAEAQTRPALWTQLRDHGLPEVVGDYWELSRDVFAGFAERRQATQFSWDLAFGPDLQPLVAYTDGAAGVDLPPRPGPFDG